MFRAFHLAYDAPNHFEIGCAVRSGFTFTLLQAHLLVFCTFIDECLLCMEFPCLHQREVDMRVSFWVFCSDSIDCFSSILHYLCEERLFVYCLVWFSVTEFQCDRLALNSYVAQAGPKFKILLAWSPRNRTAVVNYLDSCSFIWKVHRPGSPSLFLFSIVLDYSVIFA